MKNVKVHTATETAEKIEVTHDDIRRLVRKIVAGVHPEKIIMFGSRARGDNGNLSDVDILVVMNTDKPKHSRRSEVSRLLWDFDFPIDIVVYTPDEFKKAVEHEDYYFNPFIKDAVKEGIALYEHTY